MQLIGPLALRHYLASRKLVPVVVSGKPRENLTFWLEHAWNLEPICALKLIYHLCVSDKEGFYTAAIWLHQNHPLTLARNIKVFASSRSVKDFLEILRRLSADPEDRKAEDEKQSAAAGKKDREIARARWVVDKYRHDSNYRRLHERISSLFAESLKSDLEFLNSGEHEKISLASNFCPSIDSPYDKSTLICEGISRKIFPRESDSEYEQIEEAHYSYRVRQRLRKEVLVPLREALARRDSISQSPQSSVLKSKSGKVFVKGVDKTCRFYIRVAVKYARTEEAVISSALVPESCRDASETQRRKLIEDLSKKEVLKTSIAICGISSNTEGAAMKIGVAMTLLISELSESPWKGKLFTFDDYPKLEKIKGDDVHSKREFIEQLAGGERINFRRVFDRILQVSLAEKRSREKIVKRVFVFSDREFSEVAESYKKEDYHDVWENYRKRGYKTVPEIVFWNLRDPVNCSAVVISPAGMKKNVELMINGLLKNLINLFLEKEGIGNLDIFMKTIPKQEDWMTLASIEEKYKDVDLVVLD